MFEVFIDIPRIDTRARSRWEFWRAHLVGLKMRPHLDSYALENVSQQANGKIEIIPRTVTVQLSNSRIGTRVRVGGNL